MRTRKKTSHSHGVWAESLAAAYLTAKGYRILEKRYKARGGEIDIVAARKGLLVFVEVKARQNGDDALFAVGERTQRRVEQAALQFLAAHPQWTGCDMRFDVVAVAGAFSIRHLDNAWEARS